MKNCLVMYIIMCALPLPLSHEKIRQKYQLLLELCLFMWFWPEHALIWNWPHIPQYWRKLQNLILIVFYIYPAFQNAINHLLIIYGSKVKDKSLEVVSFRVCPTSKMASRTPKWCIEAGNLRVLRFEFPDLRVPRCGELYGFSCIEFSDSGELDHI